MERRLAEFREARKRAGLAAQPRTASPSAAEKAGAAAKPQAAPGWLGRLLVLVRKPRPAGARAPPSPAQEAAGWSGAPPPPGARALPRSFLTNVTFLKVLLWLVLLGLFVELEFGLAYFVLSLFYWMHVGTRGPEQRRRGEKSAYSVFNPGCEAIQGSLTAQQLERELQLRPAQGP